MRSVDLTTCNPQAFTKVIEDVVGKSGMCLNRKIIGSLTASKIHP
jgi:hypothetical protein